MYIVNLNLYFNVISKNIYFYNFRNKCGIWGWRQDKSDSIHGHTCKVFGASNVQLVTKTRTEHLSEADKAAYRGSKTPLQSFLGIAETEQRAPSPSVICPD